MLLTNTQIRLRKKLINIAYRNSITHLPSALSMLDYLYFVTKYIDFKKDAFVVGKPYGQLAYSIVWKLKTYSAINCKTKNVTWCDSTLGNCLGVAVGLALSKKYRKIYVNLSDGVLQEGTILEAMQFIGSLRYKELANIVLLVDYNSYQCITPNLIKYDTTFNIFKSMKWNVKMLDGHRLAINSLQYLNNKQTTPLCLLFKTVKGFGIDFMQQNPITWHYKKLDINTYNIAIRQLCGK